jgi:multiple antibiotic resistance protein
MKRADIAVFPLAFPFMAGPGALTTLLLWFGPIPVTQHPVQFMVMFGCALVVLALCLLVMWVAGPLMRVIGVTGTNVANRLFGVVLGALAVQFVVDGLRASFAAV